MQQSDIDYSGTRRQVSLGLLVAVNLLPLLGVLFFDWDVASLVVLYWSENLVLGFYTLVKMFVVSPLGSVGMGSFFFLHYGGFCAGHGLFILMLLVDSEVNPMPEDPWPLFLVFVQLLFYVVREVLAQAPSAWLVAFGALFISHGASFMLNFLLGPEREKATLGKLMSAPYGRIVVLHVAIILGGMGVMMLGQPVALLIILVLLKLGLDVKLHLREHRRGGPVAAANRQVA